MVKVIYLTIVLAPLIAAAIAGLFGRRVGRAGAHSITILGVSVSFLLSLYVLKAIAFDGAPIFNETIYRWGAVGGLSMEIGFLVDQLTVLMLSLIHI